MLAVCSHPDMHLKLNVMSQNENDSMIKRFFTLESTLKGLFISSIAGVSAIISFSYTLASVKKNDNTPYDKESVKLFETGSQLAVRALKWGTLCAVTGCGLIIYGGWKLSGAKDMTEFKIKMGSLVPAVPRNSPQGRTEFASLTELMRYLDDEYSAKPNAESGNSLDNELGTNS